MQTEMLIGSRFVEGHRARGEDPQPEDRRDDPVAARSLGRAGRRGGRRRRQGLRHMVAHDARPSAPAISSSSPTASRPRREDFADARGAELRQAASRRAPRRDRRRSSTASASSPAPRASCRRSAAGEYLPGYTSMVRRDPIGVVASIAPWNYPLMMAAWKLAPGARRRQHGGAEAVRADAADHAEAREDRRRDPARGRRSTSSSAAARPSATR